MPVLEQRDLESDDDELADLPELIPGELTSRAATAMDAGMAYARNVLFNPSEYFLDNRIDTRHMNYRREPFGVPTTPLEFASLLPTLDHLLDFAPTSHSIQYDQTSHVWRNMRSPWELYRLQTLGITMNVTPPTTTLVGRDERRREDENGDSDKNGNNGDNNDNNRTVRRNTTNGA